MKNNFLILGLIFIQSLSLTAQSVTDILTQVEQNNTTLKAARQTADAEKIGNKTGLAPNNPEVAFGYLWGSPSVIGNRIDFSVKQEFDFPSAYAYRNDMAKLKNEQAELTYEKMRQAVLLETRLLCCELFYHNALNSELTKRAQYADKIAAAYQKRFDSGECNVLENNKARLNMLNIRKEMETNEIERQSLQTQLTGLNDGKSIELSDTEWITETLPLDFDEWYKQAETNNPLLTWLAKEIELAQKEVKLSYAQAAPKFNAGYMMEHVIGEQYQGVTVGISLPLWQETNKVKYAKAKTIAAENTLSDQKLKFYNHLKNLHAKAVALQKNYADYRKAMEGITNYEPLQNALDKGEISLIDYLMECSIYYDSYAKMLQLQKEANSAYSELTIYE